MLKEAVLLFHGMGTFAAAGKGKDGKPRPGDFEKEFTDVTTSALQRYKKHSKQSITQQVDVHEFNYDAWFEKMRTRMADNAKTMSQKLDAVAKDYGITFASDLVGRLTSLEKEFGSEEFFYTHFLDVIFYSTMMGAKVRVDAGKKIAELVADYGQGRVHIMAYSLGTAVAHDTLHLLYRPEFDPNDEIPDLHPVNHRLGSVWMISNVSRLLNKFSQVSNPLDSAVKPGNEGCTNRLVNARHKLDPFTFLSRFNPKNNGAWIPETMYATRYSNIVTDLVLDGNTHSFAQYMDDPKLAELFLREMVTGFSPSNTEKRRVREDHAKRSINGAYALLEEEFRGLDKKDIDSWKDFISAAKALISAIGKVKSDLE